MLFFDNLEIYTIRENTIKIHEKQRMNQHGHNTKM